MQVEWRGDPAQWPGLGIWVMDRLRPGGLHLLFLSLLLLRPAIAGGVERVTFPSSDGVIITGDLYYSNSETAPFIILFHRAGWSRGEYREIAQRLVAMGYNCLAIDQRSGYAVNGVVNETAIMAEKAGKRTEFLDAYQDMEAALDYVKTKLARGPVVLWGSSYSASLALILAARRQKDVAAVLAFSPGEYFARFGKSPTLVRDGVSRLAIPVFLTSARQETSRWKEIFSAIPSKRKTAFLPKAQGVHGSEALWRATDGHEEYWLAVESFLSEYAPGGR